MRAGSFRLLSVSRTVLLPPRAGVVTLDHLVERGRLDVEQLGRAFLDATRRFERRLDEALLEVCDHVFERNTLGRHDELRHLEGRRLADVLRNEVGPDARYRRE